MPEERREDATRGTRPSLEDAAADALPPGRYWEAHRFIGQVPLSDNSRIHLNAVKKDGAWYLRLRPYRRARGGDGETWVAVQQVLLFPPEALPILRELVGEAERTLDSLMNAGLSPEELAAESASELPDRDALSLIRGDFSAL
jgi:hypothetical protein